ncbi:MAG: DUF2007 domain-containing protein [Isosphaeraceae bacterium]
MWTCSKCGSKVDASFEVCWHCGATVDGVEDPNFVPADIAPPEDKSPLEIDMPEGEEPVPEAPGLGGELVECYWALDVMQAKFLADQLTEAGIPAVSDTQDMSRALGSLSSTPRVFVRAVDHERAKAWLDAFERNKAAEHGGSL